MGIDRIARAIVLAGLLAGLVLIPVQRVAACSCAWMELPEAIGEADLAVVGRLVGSTDVQDLAGMERPVTMTWAVERSRGPIDADHVVISAWKDNGANCGASFTADERWLVLAYRGEEGFETNGCMRNVRLDGAAPDEIAIIDEMVATPVGSTTPTAEGWQLPVPVLVGGGLLLLLGAVSLLAFRRADPSSS